jgi:hypothetical protein
LLLLREFFANLIFLYINKSGAGALFLKFRKYNTGTGTSYNNLLLVRQRAAVNPDSGLTFSPFSKQITGI